MQLKSELKTTLSQISQKFIFKASYWVLFIKKKSHGSFYKNRPNKLSSNVQIINMLHTVLHLHHVMDSGLLFLVHNYNDDTDASNKARKITRNSPSNDTMV